MDTYGESMIRIVSVGTPPRPFRVIFDTGHEQAVNGRNSSTFWLPVVGCHNFRSWGQFCRNRTSLYDRRASSTAKKTHEFFYVRYGEGAVVGFVYEDLVAFGAPNERQLKLRRPVRFGGGFLTLDGDQGILGLSFRRPKERTNSLFEEAVRQRVLDRPLFSVFLRKCPPGRKECAGAGEIVLGGEDRRHCGRMADWIPLVNGTTDWEFEVDSLRIGHSFTAKNVRAISDTGSSHLFLPKRELKRVVRSLGAKKRGDGFVVPCTSAPEVRLSVRGREYVIPPAQIGDRIDKAGKKCLLYLGSNGNEQQWILGDSWIRSYCQVHDWGNRRIGFAPVIAQ
ncbi:Eukaryotic aspartyl protease [Aphelenchoides fujianensis]|nr:Eukaryotic aspartyl protease [Aphelenchoides fujianensis]